MNYEVLLFKSQTLSAFLLFLYMGLHSKSANASLS